MIIVWTRPIHRARSVEELLQGDSNDILKRQQLIEHEEEVEEDRPKLEEILEVLKQLKNNKNPGVHVIRAEMIKCTGLEVAEALQVLMITIWKKATSGHKQLFAHYLKKGN